MHRFGVRVGLVLTVILSAMFSIVALAYENEPYDFRGMKWDTHIEKLSDMEIVLDGGDLKAYTKKGEKMKLEEAKLSALHYIFYKDHFYCVHIEFKGLDDFNKIKDVLFKRYGEPEGIQLYDKRFAWPGVNASITLEFDESIGRGELGYKFLPIDQEIVGEETNQTAEDAE
ncbi:MAG: hypothetical protein JRI70_09020 [Deltaproteobacteria bacterium]|nr:hypothetical protein [Deltaproteobacteria bacterium]MBW2171869.1 hypothetical protein [Deltaproteobacteria bacterium]